MDLTDQQWTIIEPLFEEKRRPDGAPILKNPDTGKRVSRLNPSSEWMTREVAALAARNRRAMR